MISKNEFYTFRGKKSIDLDKTKTVMLVSLQQVTESL